jgi:hypothetical protein
MHCWWSEASDQDPRGGFAPGTPSKGIAFAIRPFSSGEAENEGSVLWWGPGRGPRRWACRGRLLLHTARGEGRDKPGHDERAAMESAE